MIPVIGLAIIIGITLGLLGGGGGILTVPLLHYGLTMPVDRTITTSLLIICITSVISTWQHAKHHHVLRREGSLLSLSGIVGTVIGGKFALKVSVNTLRKNFSLFIIVIALLLVATALPVAIQQDWFIQHAVSWAVLMLAITVSLFYFLTRSCLSTIWRVPFFK